ncbi:Uu.00g124580.m01.CDS01 [Anthostomella pinea]|uniref:Uu.00g124580.m01.CDS01 n=1 Tax=Anthostomella pinea TaxID=933095 RepID=A0AAI8VIM8_9PEZI|nr:Uu.00g124580.m01.CDS01 [Anthostomella pinea]
MASGMNNYASGSMNEYAGANMHSLSVRPGSSRPGSRYAPPAPARNNNNNNNEHAEPWDQISDEHRNEINDCFHLFDMNKDDLLDFSEFRYAMQALGFSHVPRPDLIASFKSAAHPRPSWTPLPSMPNQPPPSPTPGVVDLRLSLPSFQAVAGGYIAARDPREEVLKTFALFDKAGKGIISVDDLRAVVKELGEDVPENEILSMVDQFDIEAKGGVSREEFVGIFLDR